MLLLLMLLTVPLVLQADLTVVALLLLAFVVAGSWTVDWTVTVRLLLPPLRHSVREEAPAVAVEVALP